MKRKAKNLQTGPFDPEIYRTLFETIDDGFAIIELERDEQGKITDVIYRQVNPAFEQHTGLKNSVGKRISDLLPNLEQSTLDMVQRVADTGEPSRTETYTVDLARWHDVIYLSVDGPGSDHVVAVFKDITERKQRERQQQFLLRFSDVLRAEPNADAVANRALQMLCEQLQLDRCYVGVYRLAEDRGDFTHQVGNDRVPPVPDGVRLSDFPDALRVAFDRTLVIDDVAVTEGLTDMDRQSLGALGLRALVAATLRKGDNNPLWSIVAVSARPRRWTQDEVALIEEVTERTWTAMESAGAEAALRESEERLRGVLDGMKEGFGVLAPDFTILEHNREALRMDGRAREEIVGRSHWEVFPGSENSELGRLLKKAMAERIPVSLEHRYAWEADRALWLEMRAYPTSDGMLAVFWRDVTERREAQDALRASEARLQKAISIKTVGVLFFRLDGHITDANATFLQMVGYSREELLAIRDWALLTPPEFMEATSKTAGELAEHGETAPYEKQMIRKDGTRFWGLFAPTRLSGSGLDSECIEFIIDITDRKRTEEALTALNDSLEQRVQEKTTQLRNLASELTRAEQRERNRISHILHDDLQQRIYSILMRMNTLGNELPGQNQAFWHEVSELEGEIKTTLEIARHLSIDLNPPILPGEGLLHAIQWLAQQILERYKLPIQIQAEDPLILSDEELHVLLFNCVRELLFNVVKHAEATQTIVRLQKSDDKFQIVVHDNGKGFSVDSPPSMENLSIDPTEELPLSFGLSTIRHKLSLYGGSMEITSQPGEGTRVTLVVPVAENGSD